MSGILPLRSYDDHQAVSKDAHSHQKVRQRQPELQHSNCSVIVVVPVKQKGIFAVSLLMTHFRQIETNDDKTQTTGKNTANTK